MVFKRSLMMLLALCVVLSFSLPLYASNDGKININSAGVEELAKLDRVGEKYAQRIVEYRETNGPFEKPEDIMKVKGIGSKIWDANKDRIAVK
ncbi:MAG: helix-hairpin-helix domain-containing protein [Deltaproteobacteria bacterium]|jgi:competence protein ComEA|nr:helix-hairpin-helix domain-containing protein [Deltaproteobacteria bacterium]